MTGGKAIPIRSQFISDMSAVNPLVAFYDIHGRKWEVLAILCSVPNTTRDFIFVYKLNKKSSISHYLEYWNIIIIKVQ
jgi:hypothetical protein